MRRTAVLLLAVAAVALPLSKSYDVVPYKNCIGTAPGGAQFGVSQYVRNTLDSLSVVSVWIGDTFGGENYKVEVKDSATGQLVAEGPTEGRHATQCWAWLDFPLTKDAEPVRGRTYKVVVTRQSGQSVSFAYCDTNPNAV